MDAISAIVEIVDKIHTQSDKLKRNKAHFRQLSRQAEVVVEDIRGHYATADGNNVQLPPKVVDGLSQMELILGKILKVLEKERQRNSFIGWLKASDQATVCSDLSNELSACASLINVSTSVHILGETRVLSIQQGNVALRDEELLRNLSFGTTRLVTQFQTYSADGSNHPSMMHISRYASASGGEPSSYYSTTSSDSSGSKKITCFQSFLECLDEINSPSFDVPSSSLHEALSIFFQHVESRHEGPNICYAATETFVVEYQDQIKVLGCIAVLKEEYDLAPLKTGPALPSAARCRTEFILEFTLLDTPQSGHASSPSDWIQVQGLADHFDKERICFALWDLGRLPPGSHLPETSETFRWIKQSVTSVQTPKGTTLVVDIESGSHMQPFRRFHQLNARIAHPANATHRLELIEHLDNEICRACAETNEEWFIALVAQLPLMPSPSDRKRYLAAHKTYVAQATKLEIDGFASMGIFSPLSAAESTGEQKDFAELYAEGLAAVEKLFQPLHAPFPAASVSTVKMSTAAVTAEHLAFARVIGRLWWKIHTTVVLLSPEQREASSNFTRVPLARLRRELAESAQPLPPLIWNYIPPHLTARARNRRLQLGTPPTNV